MVISRHVPYLFIRISDAQNPAQRYAARELSHFLAEITGARLPVHDARTAPPAGPAIVVGYAENGPIAKEDIAAPDSFGIAEADGTLYIAGQEPRGTLYGVYGFLEEVCGCRFFAGSCNVVPKKDAVEIPEGYRFFDKPVFPYRELFYRDTFPGDTAARLRLNGDHHRLHAEHGGKLGYVPGYFVHTFSKLVPPAKYYKDHPEYFALRDGRREDHPFAQLCLSNPEVLEIATQKALEDLRAHPDCAIISISQNDGLQPCQCEACRKIVEEEGSESGPIIRFVNKVAEAIEKEFPHVWVDTLAYDYSRKPPKHVRPRRNVIVRLCTFECCFTHPLAECPEIADTKRPHVDPIFRDFAGDLKRWAEISEKLFIWDYVTDFEFYCNIHPNLHVLKPNMKLFAENKVQGVFPQGNGQSHSGEMAELRAYLLAKLLWNPDFDVEKGTKEFLDAWFGPAAPFIAEFLELTHKALVASGYHMSLYDVPTVPFLSDEQLKTCDDLMDKAEKAVASDPVLSARVAKERLSVRIAKFFRQAPDSGREEAVEQFISDAKCHGITHLSEKWGFTNIRVLSNKGVWPPEPCDMTPIRDY